MGMDDHYATLRVAPDADSGAVRSAYRALMRRYHPDVNGSDSAVARAKAINEAYACLRDPSKRASYDRERASERGRASDGAPLREQGPAPSPLRTPRWTGDNAAAMRRLRRGRPTWWQLVGLGGASIVTAITFSATSATPPFVAPAAAPGAIAYVGSVAGPPKSPEPRKRPRAARE